MSFFANRSIKNISKPDLIIYIFLAYCLLIITTYIFSYSVDLEGMEFSFLFHLQILKEYGTIYNNPDAYPYFICFYPPLYAAFMNKFCEVMHVNVFTDLHRAFVWGRIISMVLMFVNVRIIGKMIFLFTEKKARTLHIVILLLLLLPMHFFTFRPDSFKVTLFVYFVYNYLRYHHDTGSKKHLIFALISAAISVFFKHDVIIYIYLFLGLHWLFYLKKDSIFFTCALTFLILSGVAFFTKIYGFHFLKNVFLYTIQYSSDVRINLFIISINLLKTLPLLYFAYKNTSSGNRKIKFIAVCSFVYALTSNLFLLRPGANINYTYETLILLIINFFLYTSERQLKKYSLVLLLFYLFVLNNKMLDPAYLKEENKEAERQSYIENISTAKLLKQMIGDDVIFFTNGKYLIFNGGLNKMCGYDLHLDRFTEVYMNMPIRSTMYKNSSVRQYDEAFRNGVVKYIAIDNNAVSAKQIQTYYDNYSFYKQVGNLMVYKFNAAP